MVGWERWAQHYACLQMQSQYELNSPSAVNLNAKATIARHSTCHISQPQQLYSRTSVYNLAPCNYRIECCCYFLLALMITLCLISFSM